MLDQDQPPAFLLQSRLQMLLSPTLSAHQPQPPTTPHRAVPTLAATLGDGLGCLPGPRPGAGTAGPGAIPEAVVPVDALAPKKDLELIYLVGGSMKRDADKSLGLLGLLSTAETGYGREGPRRATPHKDPGDWRQEKERRVNWCHGKKGGGAAGGEVIRPEHGAACFPCIVAFDLTTT